jgi:hypothetical protein
LYIKLLSRTMFGDVPFEVEALPKDTGQESVVGIRGIA